MEVDRHVLLMECGRRITLFTETRVQSNLVSSAQGVFGACIIALEVPGGESSWRTAIDPATNPEDTRDFVLRHAIFILGAENKNICNATLAGLGTDLGRKWLAMAMRECWVMRPHAFIAAAIRAPMSMIAIMNGAPSIANTTTGAVAPGPEWTWEKWITALVMDKVQEDRRERVKKAQDQLKAEGEARGADGSRVPFVSAFDKRPQGRSIYGRP